MCTLLTISKDLYNSKSVRRIIHDATWNSHGFALITVDSVGDSSVLRTLSLEAVFAVLDHSDWTRMFLHSRYATQGSHTIENCHGWSDDGSTFYMHNGMLKHLNATKYRVDSQLIGEWLSKEGSDKTLKNLDKEHYANVFLVNPSNNWYCVHRSKVGTLFTDGEGNYSSNRFARINKPVDEHTHRTFDIYFKPKRLTVASMTDEEAELAQDLDLVDEQSWINQSINALTDSQWSDLHARAHM